MEGPDEGTDTMLDLDELLRLQLGYRIAHRPAAQAVGADQVLLGGDALSWGDLSRKYLVPKDDEELAVLGHVA
jgi:hypothetical protein